MSVENQSKQGRWAGRNSDKDVIRDKIWKILVDEGQNVGPTWSRIPNFVGADLAAKRLSELDFWTSAKVVKCNPDPPQIPVRLRALYDGKLLYTPVPELVEGFPFVLLDPARLEADGVQFELAATSQGAVEYGQPVSFQEMAPMDVIVVGCVGVTRSGGRTGKGGGFADLELGIFRELGKVPDHAVIVTTVHSSQVVDDDDIVMMEHDSALEWICTEKEVIQTRSPYPQPTGVAWDMVQPDQLEDIPFLKELKRDLSSR
ncbi:5-formyltetrahydrofolate cyclo-ligase [Sedimentitalea sp. XS_ASV28]|uniref:5-formyltetrahydrofolate cyclo-ligase n=1 Tax=Sedimentitalea sp. XS_ASV28 TaxID=3241296 RepID=UPI0035147B67